MPLSTRLTYWIPALLASALGTWILYDAHPGINWGLWVATTSIGLIACRLLTHAPLRNHTMVLLGWATMLAFAQSFTGVPVHAPLIIASVAILLGLAVTTLDDSASGIGLPSVAQVPFTALSRVARQSAMELLAIPANARSLRNRPALRGALFAIPIVLLLAALLSRADPLLDSVRTTLLGWLDHWELDGHVIFFIVLAAITVGAYGLASHDRKQLPPLIGEVPPPFRITATETRVILGSVNVVLWIFVLLQLFSLTRNPGGTAGTGFTYAEYARRGFAELSVAAAIVLGVILFTEVFRVPGPNSGKPRFDLTAILAVELILASAFHRVLLYEAAYGYTTDRLIAQAYMLVLACAFIALAWDLSRGGISAAFGRRGMALTLTALTVFTYWNYESWVVRENLERARNGGRLDLVYLESLSLAAVPALIEGRSRMTASQSADLDDNLRCRKVADAPHWYEWNLRRENARAALAPFAGKCSRGD